ncbi:MAG TPA: DUF3298 domain-containing protein [Pyrinomonadaceae bacterium]|jgi:hypothetical protein
MSAALNRKRKVKRRHLPATCAAWLLACCCCCAPQTTNHPSPAQAKETPPRTSTRQGVVSQSPADAKPADPAQTLPALERGADAFESVINLSGGRRFETRTIEKRLTKRKFVVTARYPELTGDRSTAARGFNQSAESLVARDLKPFLKDERDPEKERHPHWRDVEEDHVVSHKVIFASDEIISVFFYAYGYSWGAAHGYHYPLVLNYDLKRGRLLRLADLFRPGPKYLQTIADYCLCDLSRQLDLPAEEIEGAKPRPKNYRAWVLTPKGLVIIFEEYQVTSYAGGEPKVLIPYERLRGIINPRGVLAALAVSG